MDANKVYKEAQDAILRALRINGGFAENLRIEMNSVTKANLQAVVVMNHTLMLIDFRTFYGITIVINELLPDGHLGVLEMVAK